jgi:hypothetical protein
MVVGEAVGASANEQEKKKRGHSKLVKLKLCVLVQF